jgi:hypothetical protein
MRNIPFPFISEATIDEINRVQAKRNADRSAVRATFNRESEPTVKSVVKRFLSALDRMMEMSGPNSIASLERAFRPAERKRTDPR